MTFNEFENRLNQQNNKTKEKEVETSDKEFGLKLSMDSAVYQKIMHWVNKSDFEVSGLGTVVYDQDNNSLKVIDAIILPQKNTGTTTDIEPEDVNKAMYLMRNSPGKLRFWWHSHVNMNVFWSGTDVDTIKKLGAGGWFCATVFNKRRETKSAFCQNEPVRLLVSDIPTEITENVELTKQWDEEYDKNVKNVKHDFSRSIEGFNIQELQNYIHQNKDVILDDLHHDDDLKNKMITIDGQELSFEDFVKISTNSKKNIVPVQRKSYASISETGQLNLPGVTSLKSDSENPTDDDQIEGYGNLNRKWF